MLRGIMKTRRINSIIPTGFQLSKTRILYPATLGKLRSPGNERRNSRNVWARLKTLREPSGWYREGKVIEEDSRQLQLQNPDFLDPDLSYLGRCIFASIRVWSMSVSVYGGILINNVERDFTPSYIIFLLQRVKHDSKDRGWINYSLCYIFISLRFWERGEQWLL